MFQVVPPCGGHQRTPPPKRCKRKFQVVPPCGGHRPGDVVADVAIIVSSRAPVWGASRSAPCCGQPHIVVSSRAPVWGASRSRAKAGTPEVVSSRAPVWGASGSGKRIGGCIGVSSRAPVWGASLCFGLLSSLLLLFQVVPPCGGHRGICPASVARGRFKSCPRVGGIPIFGPILYAI